ncbi:MAG: hypothetical protein OEN50_10465 [Deltaproteobacteria bacterium]|nr:hypothetical protein [Deltaproteobacteria bacterium]
MPQIDTNFGQVGYSGNPDICPICHVHLHTEPLVGSLTGPTDNQKSNLEIVFRCPRDKCGSLFIVHYRRYSKLHGGLSEFQPFNLSPITPQPPNVPDSVKEVSERFLDIYTQALAAERHHLPELVGLGLRKALEFLIKDYCIQRNKADEETIKSEYLSTCINERVDDENLKRCAKLATWIGNDETHYVRRWKTKDIEDLKILVRLTITWIENNLLTEEYMAEMDTPKDGGE